MLFVVIVAASAWGIYAWKFNATADSQTGSTEILASGLHQKDDAGASNSPDSSRPGDADHSTHEIRPNTPATIDNSRAESSIADASNASPGSDSPRTKDEYGNSPSTALNAGREALSSGQVIKARAALSKALAMGIGPSDQDLVRRELTRLSDALIFSRAASPEDALTGYHVVKGGESLFVIAARYRISEELIMTLNQIKDRDTIYAGSRLKIIHGPFSAKIYKGTHRMDIFLGDIYVRSFKVGLGTAGGTPTGDWIIKSKLRNPDWSDPATGAYYSADDPDNPIGERWISLECVSGDCMGRIGFGIHGTIDPKSIGADMSMGCVRLSAEDVATVFDLLVQKYSEVSILP